MASAKYSDSPHFNCFCLPWPYSSEASFSSIYGLPIEDKMVKRKQNALSKGYTINSRGPALTLHILI